MRTKDSRRVHYPRFVFSFLPTRDAGRYRFIQITGGSHYIILLSRNLGICNDVGKNPVVCLAHVGDVQSQSAFAICERGGARKSHTFGDERSLGFGVWQRVCLQSVLHLQSMLKRTQERVGLGQIGSLLFSNEIAVGESSQTDQRVSYAQPLVTGAVSQL